MPDDLTTRCLAEVERAMAADLEGDDGSGYDAAWETYKQVQPGPHDDDLLTAILQARDKVLASRLARMLAAGIREGIAAFAQDLLGVLATVDRGEIDYRTAARSAVRGAHEKALRAVAQAREAP